MASAWTVTAARPACRGSCQIVVTFRRRRRGIARPSSCVRQHAGGSCHDPGHRAGTRAARRRRAHDRSGRGRVRPHPARDRGPARGPAAEHGHRGGEVLEMACPPDRGRSRSTTTSSDRAPPSDAGPRGRLLDRASRSHPGADPVEGEIVIADDGAGSPASRLPDRRRAAGPPGPPGQHRRPGRPDAPGRRPDAVPIIVIVRNEGDAEATSGAIVAFAGEPGWSDPGRRVHGGAPGRPDRRGRAGRRLHARRSRRPSRPEAASRSRRPSCSGSSSPARPWTSSSTWTAARAARSSTPRWPVGATWRRWTRRTTGPIPLTFDLGVRAMTFDLDLGPWGVDLDDAAFGRSLAALGVALASAPPRLALAGVVQRAGDPAALRAAIDGARRVPWAIGRVVGRVRPPGHGPRDSAPDAASAAADAWATVVPGSSPEDAVRLAIERYATDLGSYRWLTDQLLQPGVGTAPAVAGHRAGLGPSLALAAADRGVRRPRVARVRRRPRRAAVVGAAVATRSGWTSSRRPTSSCCRRTSRRHSPCSRRHRDRSTSAVSPCWAVSAATPRRRSMRSSAPSASGADPGASPWRACRRGPRMRGSRGSCSRCRTTGRSTSHWRRRPRCPTGGGSCWQSRSSSRRRA